MVVNCESIVISIVFVSFVLVHDLQGLDVDSVTVVEDSPFVCVDSLLASLPVTNVSEGSLSSLNRTFSVGDT